MKKIRRLNVFTDDLNKVWDECQFIAKTLGINEQDVWRMTEDNRRSCLDLAKKKGNSNASM